MFNSTPGSNRDRSPKMWGSVRVVMMKAELSQTRRPLHASGVCCTLALQCPVPHLGRGRVSPGTVYALQQDHPQMLQNLPLQGSRTSFSKGMPQGCESSSTHHSPAVRPLILQTHSLEVILKPPLVLGWNGPHRAMHGCVCGTAALVFSGLRRTHP